MIPEKTQLALKTYEIDVVSATVRAALINDSIDYEPDPLNHEVVADVLNDTTASEFDDTNYSRKTVQTSATFGGDSVDAKDITWEELGGTQDIQAVIIYQQVGGDDSTPEDDPILRIIDESVTPELPLPTRGADVTISWSPRGMIEYAHGEDSF